MGNYESGYPFLFQNTMTLLVFKILGSFMHLSSKIDLFLIKNKIFDRF